MKLGVFTPLFNNLIFDEMIAEIGRASCRERVSSPV